VKIIENYYIEAKGKKKKIDLFITVGEALLEDSWSKEVVIYINLYSLFTNTRHNNGQTNSV